MISGADPYTHKVPTHIVPMQVHRFVPVTNLSVGLTLSACPISMQYTIGPTMLQLALLTG